MGIPSRPGFAARSRQPTPTARPRRRSATDGARAETVDARVTFEAIDFGPVARPRRTLVATFGAGRPGAEVEVWLGDARKLGAARSSHPGAGVERLGIPLRTDGIVGAHALVLRLRGGPALGQLTEIELR